jgi:glycosyltransferase involved in cell wall biosynthesis
MYHGNLAASLLSHTLGGRARPVVWTIRQSLYDLKKEKPLTRVVIRASQAISATPSLTIYNSREAAASHAKLGFSPGRQIVIPNGFDCRRFFRDAAARSRVRRELGIPEDRLVIGHVARYHEIKGHRLLIDAAAALRDWLPSAMFLLIGLDVDDRNPELTAAIRDAGLESRFKLLGLRADIPALTAAFDLAVLSSRAESFPNVVAEAMACEVPVVATDVGGDDRNFARHRLGDDVGDCAAIVGDTGVICPYGDPDALAAGIMSLAALSADERRRLGARARARIQTNFTLESVAQRYWDVYASVLGPQPKRSFDLSFI